MFNARLVTALALLAGCITAALFLPNRWWAALLLPVLAVAGVIINAGRFWFYRASLDRRALSVVLVASLPFLVLGTWIYSLLDARALGTVLGLLVIAFIPMRRILKAKAIVLGTPSLAVGAGVFGLASGVASGRAFATSGLPMWHSRQLFRLWQAAHVSVDLRASVPCFVSQSGSCCASTGVLTPPPTTPSTAAVTIASIVLIWASDLPESGESPGVGGGYRCPTRIR